MSEATKAGSRRGSSNLDLPTVDVVTVSYRDAAYFPRFLQGLGALDYPPARIHIIIADNGSKDGALEVLGELLPKAPFKSTVIECGENLGFGGGSNRAAGVGDGSFILFLNPDTKPEPEMLKQLVGRALAEPRAGLIEAVQVPYPVAKLAASPANYLDWCSGGVLLARREAFSALGGFDEIFHPTYCEDVDLSWRMWLNGWTCSSEPKARVLNDNNPVDGTIKPNEIFYTAKFSFAMHFTYDSLGGLAAHILKGLRYAISPQTQKMRRKGVLQGLWMLAAKFGPLMRRRRSAQRKMKENPSAREHIVFTEWYYGRWQTPADAKAGSAPEAISQQ